MSDAQWGQTKYQSLEQKNIYCRAMQQRRWLMLLKPPISWRFSGKHFYFYYHFIIYLFWPGYSASGILVPWPGIKPMLPAMEAWCLFFPPFKKLLILNWRIIALRCCICFCHSSTWSSRKYTHGPLLLNLPPASHPSRLSQRTRLSSLCSTAISH